jgi:hypothetical protein
MQAEIASHITIGAKLLVGLSVTGRPRDVGTQQGCDGDGFNRMRPVSPGDRGLQGSCPLTVPFAVGLRRQ